MPSNSRGALCARKANDVASLSDVFRVLDRMKTDGVIEDYALGGAMATLFYAEPTRTYDLDVFIVLPRSDQAILSLTPVYDWLKGEGFEPHAEHVMVHGVPVQLIPAYNDLVKAAIANARVHEYEGVPVRVSPPEHLIALALQAGGARRRERAFQLLDTADIDREILDDLLRRHGIPAPWRGGG